MSIANFTPWSGLAGGLLVGLATLVLLAGLGRIAGISGIFGGALGHAPVGDRQWRWVFVAGLVVGGLLYSLLVPGGYQLTLASPTPMAVIGAFIVGFGTRLGSGCTSGHGICGMSRFSPRSIVATMTFMAFGFLTVFVVRHLI